MRDMLERVVACELAEALRAQEVDARIFLPFVVHALREDDHALAARLSVRVIGRDLVERFHELQVTWTATDVPALPPAVQSRIVTEWAALGIACVVLHALSDGLRLTGVAAEGDRFDYWVGDEEWEWGLEVSGTADGSLSERHGKKIDQLSSNPHGVDGFVIVTRFASKEAWFTFHRFDDGKDDGVR
jgi:hypothetical protein